MPAVNGKIKFTGMKEMTNRLNRLAKASETGMDKAVMTLANAVLQDAKNDTPVDTGDLKESGKIVRMTGNKKNTFTIAITFDVERGYALIQHETEWYNHRVGKDHYLSDVLEAYSGTSRSTLAAIVWDELQKD
jgi:bacteriophage HK97-gp10 putative tail-component